MKYFSYHGKIKSLINGGHLIDYEFLDEYHGIKPVLLLYFDNYRPLPVREHKWANYELILQAFDNKNSE